MKVAIIDDEPLAREGLSNYVREVDFLELAGTFDHPISLISKMDQIEIDLIMLDIQMPKMSGIEFLKMKQHAPIVIITTAFPSYAIEGFRLNVLDYLVKPIMFDRFVQATQKAKAYHQLLHHSTNSTKKKRDDYFFVKCGHSYEKICFKDIRYIQGMQNYAAIYTEKAKYVTLLSLKSIEENLDSDQFIRVHKSYIIAISKIDSVDSHEIHIQSDSIPLSRNYREKVMNKVVEGKLWKK